MLTDQTMNAVLAIVAGSVVAVLLLIPVAAVQYRRDGTLSPRDLMVLLAAAIYGLALWTYTLLPMPATGDFTCQPRQLELLASFRPLWHDALAGPAGLLRSSAFHQLALNVALFVPFGFFVRLVLRRGVVVATALGFAMSLLIETTQGTGVWGLYDCPYRLFDVDDLVTNTAVALVGSLLSALFVSRAPRRAHLPRHVTLGRRWIGMLCDTVFVVVLGSVAQVGYRAAHLYGEGGLDAINEGTQALVAVAVPGALQLASVLWRGRTIGEWTVGLRTVPRRPALALPGRLVKFATGVGALLLLVWWAAPVSEVALLAFGAVSALAAWPGREHPGLTNTLGGLRLEVDLPPEPVGPHRGHHGTELNSSGPSASP